MLPGCKPIIGKEFVDLLGGVAHDATQHVFEVFLRINAQIPTGLNQGKDGGAGLAAVLAAHEEPVLAANGEWTDSALSHVVIQTGVGVVEVVWQVGCQALEVIQRLCEVGLRQQSAGQQALLDHLHQLVEDGLFFLPTDPESLFRLTLPCYPLEHEQVAYLA